MYLRCSACRAVPCAAFFRPNLYTSAAQHKAPAALFPQPRINQRPTLVKRLDFDPPGSGRGGFFVARGTPAWHTRPMRMDLSPAQISLLQRLQRGPITFSGAELDDDRLAMLQLYIAGLVAQVSRQATDNPIKWCIAPLGSKTLRSLRS